MSIVLAVCIMCTEEPLQCPPRDYCFVIDTSASVDASEFDQMKDFLEYVVREIYGSAPNSGVSTSMLS